MLYNRLNIFCAVLIFKMLFSMSAQSVEEVPCPKADFIDVSKVTPLLNTTKSIIIESSSDGQDSIDFRSPEIFSELSRLQPYIYFGKAAPEEAATVYVEGFGKCTGVLIGSNKILTAQHCVCKSCNMRVKFGPSADGTDVIEAKVLRSHLRANTEKFVEGSIVKGFDLAVLDISEYKACDLYKLPAQIVTAAQLATMKPSSLIVVGYGITEKKEYGQKRSASINVGSQFCSERWARLSNCVLFNEFILTNKDKNGKTPAKSTDSCRGDSGGPAVLKRGAQPPLLVGIVSRGYGPHGSDGTNCGQGGIYGLVGTLQNIKWLKKYVSDLKFADTNYFAP